MGVQRSPPAGRTSRGLPWRCSAPFPASSAPETAKKLILGPRLSPRGPVAANRDEGAFSQAGRAWEAQAAPSRLPAGSPVTGERRADLAVIRQGSQTPAGIPQPSTRRKPEGRFPNRQIPMSSAITCCRYEEREAQRRHRPLHPCPCSAPGSVGKTGKRGIVNRALGSGGRRKPPQSRRSQGQPVPSCGNIWRSPTAVDDGGYSRSGGAGEAPAPSPGTAAGARARSPAWRRDSFPRRHRGRRSVTTLLERRG